MLAAIRAWRAGDGRAVLCTGRILRELRADFPDVDEHFDAIVAENGAVCMCAVRGEQALVPPVEPELERALRNRGVPVRRGTVLLATTAAATETVAAEIARLGLDAQLIHNRGELMVLPSGVTKATGLADVLAEMGLSPHDAFAVGDAENDHALLESCELGVAVGNAVESLKRHADLVLSAPNGQGIIEFLEGPVVRGDIVVHPERWKLDLGRTPADEPVKLPGSDINVLIAGATGSGKSYLAGLLIERAVALGYTLCVIDPEGDHRDLGRLRGVMRVGGSDTVPRPDDMVRLLSKRISIVIDLSLLQPPEQAEYWRELSKGIEALWTETGIPHWTVIEEANRFFEPDAEPPSRRGYCLVTYHPTVLPATVLDRIDHVLALRGAEYLARIPILEENGSLPPADLETTFTLEAGDAIAADREGAVPFRPSARRTQHVRHWHKYVAGSVPQALRFQFRSGAHETGRSAGNLVELHREIRRAPDSVLEHHVHHGDFSRWFDDVIQDDAMGRDVRALERWAQSDSHPDDKVVRRALLRLIERRYRDPALANDRNGRDQNPAVPAG